MFTLVKEGVTKRANIADSIWPHSHLFNLSHVHPLRRTNCAQRAMGARGSVMNLTEAYPHTVLAFLVGDILNIKSYGLSRRHKFIISQLQLAQNSWHKERKRPWDRYDSTAQDG